jgi:general secretion pathway protein G
LNRYSFSAFRPVRQGFTLIELLVVIAIIALLAAILFPVFATARAAARKTVCLSNLRQIGIGLRMYADDYDGLAPAARDASDAFVPAIWTHTSPACQAYIDTLPMMHSVPHLLSATKPNPDFYETGVLDSYLKSKEIWKCSGDTGFDFLDNNNSCNGPCQMPAHPSMYEKYGASYLYRTAIGLSGKPLDSLAGQDLDGKEVGPAQYHVLFDGNGSWHGGAFSAAGIGLRYICVFADGHAKLLTNSQYQEAWSYPVGSSYGIPCE